jgi:hypothetical protein
MARYPLGGPVNVPLVVRNPATQALTNDATLALVVKLRNADGTNTTTGTYGSPANDSTGNYHQLVPASDLTATGHYQWTATATGTGAGVTFGEFDMFDPLEPSLLPLADAKDALNIPQPTITSDAEILAYVATIENSLEAMTGGPLINTTVTERAEFSHDMLTLQVRQRPLVSVTSVTSIPDGAAVDLSAGLDLDVLTGEIRTKLGTAFSAFSHRATVIYVAGWGTVMPAAFNTASRIILQGLWETQHGPSARPSMAGGQGVPLPGFGFLIPPQAAEILGGSLNGVPFMTEVFA